MATVKKPSPSKPKPKFDGIGMRGLQKIPNYRPGRTMQDDADDFIKKERESFSFLSSKSSKVFAL